MTGLTLLLPLHFLIAAIGLVPVSKSLSSLCPSRNLEQSCVSMYKLQPVGAGEAFSMGTHTEAGEV